MLEHENDLGDDVFHGQSGIESTNYAETKEQLCFGEKVVKNPYAIQLESG